MTFVLTDDDVEAEAEVEADTALGFLTLGIGVEGRFGSSAFLDVWSRFFTGVGFGVAEVPFRTVVEAEEETGGVGFSCTSDLAI